MIKEKVVRTTEAIHYDFQSFHDPERIKGDMRGWNTVARHQTLESAIENQKAVLDWCDSVKVKRPRTRIIKTTLTEIHEEVEPK